MGLKLCGCNNGTNEEKKEKNVYSIFILYNIIYKFLVRFL